MSEVIKISDQVGLLNQIVRLILDKIESDVMDIDLLIEQNKFSEISIAYAKINGIRAALSIVEREIERLMVQADSINEPRRVDPDTVKSELQGEINRIDYLLKDSAFAGETTMYITGHESYDRESVTGLLHRRSAIEFAIRLIDGQN